MMNLNWQAIKDELFGGWKAFEVVWLAIFFWQHKLLLIFLSLNR